jgi:hypothetical protein
VNRSLPNARELVAALSKHTLPSDANDPGVSQKFFFRRPFQICCRKEMAQ